MILTLINPQRPPKLWFKATLAKVKKSKRVRTPEAVVGHIWYHKLSPKKRHEILVREEETQLFGPVASGHSSTTSQKEPSMATRRKARRTLKLRRKTRRNYTSSFTTGKYVSPSIYKKPARPSKKRNAARKVARKAAKRRVMISQGQMHRPRVYKRAGRWYRARKSKLFAKSTMLNPRRRRHARRNPLNIKSILSKKVLMTGVKIGGGIALGFIMLPLVSRMLPVSMQKYDKYLGVGNVLIGALMAAFLKNKDLKDVGIVIAGTGVYDLLAMNTQEWLGLPTVLRDSKLIRQLMPTSTSVAAPVSGYADQSYVGASYGVPVAPVSPSASAYIGASYESPDSRIAGFGMDNPYDDIDGFEGM